MSVSEWVEIEKKRVTSVITWLWLWLYRFVELGNLEMQLFTIQSALYSRNMKSFTPHEGKTIKDLNHAWTRLETAEHNRELALRDEIMRFFLTSYLLLLTCFLFPPLLIHLDPSFFTLISLIHSKIQGVKMQVHLFVFSCKFQISLPKIGKIKCKCGT